MRGRRARGRCGGGSRTCVGGAPRVRGPHAGRPAGQHAFHFTKSANMPNILQLQPSSVPTRTILPILINHPPDQNPSEIQFPREEIQNLRKEYEF